MILFTFYDNFLIIFIVFTITQLSSSNGGNFLKVVKFDEIPYENYETSNKNDETLLSLNEYYDTVYNNFKFIQLPNPDINFDYEMYYTRLTNYCDTKYITFQIMKYDYLIGKFIKLLNTLRNCFDDKLYQALKIGHTVILYPRIQECVSSLKDNDNSRNGNKYSSNWFSPTDRNIIKNKIQCLQQLFEEYDKNRLSFKECLTKFKEDWHTIVKEKSNTNVIEKKDVGLLSIFSNYNYQDFERIDVIETLFSEYTGLPKSEITEKDKKFCKGNMKILSKVDYTATKIGYNMFPRKNDVNEDMFITRRKQLIYHLHQLDKHYGNINGESFDLLKKYNSVVDAGDYYRSIKIRTGHALSTESYAVYTMRSNAFELYPFPENIWKKEKKTPMYILEEEKERSIDKQSDSNNE